MGPPERPSEFYVDGRRARPGRPRRPMFPPEMWSVYSRTLSDQPRTNNAQEAYNRRLSSLVPANPGFYLFLTCLAREERVVARDLARAKRGLKVRTAKKRVYKIKDKRLKSLCTRYGTLDRQVYLRKVARNLTLGSK